MTTPSEPVAIEIAQTQPNTVSITQTAPSNFGFSLVGPQGPLGPEGPMGPAGQGVPTGGDTGQALVKASATDYDFIWGDSQPSGSILSYATNLATFSATSGIISAGEFKTEGGTIGNHEYKISDGPVTIDSTYLQGDWFSPVEDTISSWVIIKGDLTISSGVTFTPPVRKLFTVVYVSGNLILDGDISMTARGANHSGTGNSGGMTVPKPILVKDGVWIPAEGGMGGGSNRNSDNISGDMGQSGQGIGSGGGGAGGASYTAGYGGAYGATSTGARGTCFSGGPGGAGLRGTNSDSEHGQAWGGSGGLSPGDGNAVKNGSGAGNPSPANSMSNAGQDGTGGTLIVIVTGAISGTGSLSSAGSNGGNYSLVSGSGHSGGGGSGGGVIVCFCSSGVPTVNVPGGVGGSGSASSRRGGAGGSGSARVLPI